MEISYNAEIKWYQNANILATIFSKFCYNPMSKEYL